MKEKIVAFGSKVVSKLPACIRNNGSVIGTGAGVALMLGGAVLACCKTEKAKDIHYTHKEIRDTCKSNYPEFGKKALAKDYINEGKALVKNYAVPGAMLIGGAALNMTISVHNQNVIADLNRRFAELSVAYAGILGSYKKYRQNVIDDLGEEADLKYRMGVVEEVGEVKKVTKNGKEKVVQEVKQVIDDRRIASPYAIPLRFTKLYTDGRDIQYIIDSVKQYQNIAQIHYDASRTNTHGKVLDMMWVYDQLGVTNWLTDYQQVIGKNAGWCEDCSESDQEIIFEVIQDENGETYLDFNCWGGLLLFQQAQCGIFMKPYKTGVR